MINVSMSYGFSEDNRYHLETIPTNIQLAIYKYDLYEKYKDYILETLQKRSIKVNVVHLPLDVFRVDLENIVNMISDILKATSCTNFVIHPNKGIRTFLPYFEKHYVDHTTLCIETFNWKRKKVFRTPLEIIKIMPYYDLKLSMTLDTSHLEDVWFDHKIMRHLLQHTAVIHLSNRAEGIGEHLPFTDPRGDLNLVKFVRDLKNVYHWNGDIVLEYMPEYHHKLYKNSKYLERLLQ